jgi:hypothetical protein
MPDPSALLRPIASSSASSSSSPIELTTPATRQTTPATRQRATSSNPQKAGARHAKLTRAKVQIKQKNDELDNSSHVERMRRRRADDMEHEQHKVHKARWNAMHALSSANVTAARDHEEVANGLSKEEYDLLLIEHLHDDAKTNARAHAAAAADAAAAAADADAATVTAACEFERAAVFVQ